MGKYQPTKVTLDQYNKLHRTGGMTIFFRIDEAGQHWVKAGIKYGAELMENLGLKPQG